MDPDTEDSDSNLDCDAFDGSSTRDQNEWFVQPDEENTVELDILSAYAKANSIPARSHGMLFCLILPTPFLYLLNLQGNTPAIPTT